MGGQGARVLNGERLTGVVALSAAAMLVLAGCGQDAGVQGAGEQGAEAEETSAPAGGGAGPEDADESESGSSDEPDTEETPVPASSDGPGENLPVPEAPEGMDEDTHEAAEAAMRHWFDLFVYARNTGDVEPVQELSHEDCMSCHGHIDMVIEVFDGHGWWVQEPYEIPYLEFTDIEGGKVGGLFMIDETGFESYWANEYHSTSEGTLGQIWTGHLEFTDDGWKVLSVRYEMPAADSNEAND